jgi:hypothetical protein
MVRLGAKFPQLQNLEGVSITLEEVSARLDPLYRMYD